MEGMFQLRRNTAVEMQEFENTKLQQENMTEERFLRTQMSADELMEQYQFRQTFASRQERAADMPQQPVDEKESKTKKKRKNKLKAQAKAWQEQQGLLERVEGRRSLTTPDDQAAALFEQVLPAAKLTPAYIAEHFAEVRGILDQWREHIAVFDKEGIAHDSMSREQTLRLAHMKTMYVRGEQAFVSALGAMGYRYQPKASGDQMLLGNMTKEEKQQALRLNIAARDDLTQIGEQAGAAVAEQLLSEKRPVGDPADAELEKTYAEIERLKPLLEEHPQQAEENKALLHQLYQEIYSLMELKERNQSIVDAARALQADEATSESMRERMQVRIQTEENKLRILQKRADAMEAGIRHILTGSALDTRAHLSLKEYLPQAFEQEAQTAKEQAVELADRYHRQQAATENMKNQQLSGREKAEADLQCSMTQTDAMKERGMSMLKAYEQGSLTEQCFTAEELRNIRSIFGLSDTQALDEEQLLVAAKSMLEESAVLQTAAHNRYLAATDTKQIVLRGFQSSARQIHTMADQIGAVKKLGKKAKKNILKPMKEAEAWLGDLAEYMEKPLLLSPEDFFDATIMTLMSMFGYVEKSLRETMSVLTVAKGAGDISGMLSEMQMISSTLNEYKERIPGEAQDLRAQLLDTGDAASLTLCDIVSRAQQIKTFRIEAETENVGDGTSDVFKLKDGEKVFFFKEDEKLKDFGDTLEENLRILGNEELQNAFREKLKIYGTKDKTEEVTDLTQPGCVFGFLTDVQADISEAQLQECSEALHVDVRPYLEVQANREKWKCFITALNRQSAKEQVTQMADVRIDKGADMTARNFASERVAELLGLKGLIVRNHEAVIVEKDGVQRKGFVMEQAEGVSIKALKRMAKEEKYEIEIEGEAQKQLLNLQILDNIIGQVDRHIGNYFVSYEKDEEKKTLFVKKVVGIDNDLSFGKSEVLGINNTASILSKKKVKKGKTEVVQYSYQIGMMDKKLYEGLKSVSPELLEVNLAGVIEPEYMDALKKRYEMVKKYIFEAAEKEEDFFREKRGWDIDCQRELRANTDAQTYCRQALGTKKR